MEGDQDIDWDQSATLAQSPVAPRPPDRGDEPLRKALSGLRPRSALAATWREGDLAPRVWARLCEYLRLADYVHFQGWGEPLLDETLPQRVREARSAGCGVGLTTNGDLLLEEAAEWVVSEAIGRITVSVAGAAERHAMLRGGSLLEQTWRGIEALARRRGRRRRPRIQVGYLLTRDNGGDLADTVRAAAEAGADELFVTHLDVHPTRELSMLAAFDDRGLLPGIGPMLEDAAAAARSRRVTFRPPATRSDELLVCALDPTVFVYVSWEGRVGPCVNQMLPVTGTIPRWTGTQAAAIEPVIYGDLSDASLSAILDGAARRRFAQTFERRLAAESRFRSHALGWGAAALERLEQADARRSAELADSPLPGPCAGCPKASGW